MANTNSPSNCLIIGAGISGLSAGRELQRHGVAVTLLDKARGVGGRMATRRIAVGTDTDAVAAFDHGTQFFTARSGEFQAAVQWYLEDRSAVEWFRGQPWDATEAGDAHPRYRGAPAMTAIPKHLARELDVRLNEFVIHVQHRGDRWVAMTSGGEEFLGDTMILTPPVPQALALLQAGGVSLKPDATEALQRIVYDPCVCIMIQLNGPSRVPAPGALRLSNGPVAWIADNYRKGVSPIEGSVTIHAEPSWSREHYDQADEWLISGICAAASAWLGSPVITAQVRRWRYSKAVVTHPEACVRATAPLPLLFAGDAFSPNGVANVESAWLSGQAAARAVLGGS